MIRAGAMRELITFERKFETVQPSGAVLVEWRPEQTRRAELVQGSVDAFLRDVERTEDRKVFRLWFCEQITADMRVCHGGYTYRIARIMQLNPLYLELHCVNTVEEAPI